jgi:hypothetical protein
VTITTLSWTENSGSVILESSLLLPPHRVTVRTQHSCEPLKLIRRGRLTKSHEQTMQPSVRAFSQSLLRHQFRRPVSGVPKFYPTATRNPVNQIQPREITARLITDWIAFAFRRSVAAADRGPHRSSSPHGLPANRSHLHTWTQFRSITPTWAHSIQPGPHVSEKKPSNVPSPTVRQFMSDTDTFCITGTYPHLADREATRLTFGDWDDEHPQAQRRVGV